MFYRALVTKYGQAFVDGIFRDKDKYAKADKMFYDDKIYEFERYLKMSKRELLKVTKEL